MRIRSGVSIAVVAAFALPALAIGAIVSLPKAVAVAKLKGVNEVPSIITNASGDFTAKIFADHVDFKLSFSGLTGDTLFAHIHVGQQHTLGGVSVFLCNNTTTGPAPRPCPNGSGTVTGTFSAADVIGPTGQGVDAQEFAALLQAIADGATYANVHTTAFGTGEIRGQLLQIGQTPTGE
jgi:hypothetical protein